MFHLLGCVPYSQVAALQTRLVHEALVRGDERVVVLIGEHPPEVTVGRRGSYAHVRFDSDELKQRRLGVRFVSRAGGCVLHGPGQLAVYPIVPLAPLGWSLLDVHRKLLAALESTLHEYRVRLQPHLPGTGLWGRSGALAVVGLGERDGVSHHGAYLNVQPDLSDFEQVDIVPRELVNPDVRTTMSSLAAEHRQPVRMSSLRATLVERFSEALGCDEPHLCTGHSGLGRLPPCN